MNGSPPQWTAHSLDKWLPRVVFSWRMAFSLLCWQMAPILPWTAPSHDNEWTLPWQQMAPFLNNKWHPLSMTNGSLPWETAPLNGILPPSLMNGILPCSTNGVLPCLTNGVLPQWSSLDEQLPQMVYSLIDDWRALSLDDGQSPPLSMDRTWAWESVRHISPYPCFP